MTTLKRFLSSWLGVILMAALMGATLGHALFTAGLFNPERGTQAVTDTTYHKVLPPLAPIKARPVQPLSVAIATVPDTLKRKAAEARPIITRTRATPLRKNRQLVEMDYIDPAGIETRVSTIVERGTWEVRGDTIARVMQDRKSVRREKWKRTWRTVKRVVIVGGVAVVVHFVIEIIEEVK